MDYNTSEKYGKSSYNTIKENEKLENQNTTFKYLLASIGILVIALISYFIFSGSETHYEKGVKYMQEKEYTQAIVEFQKVDPDEKDFVLAQSKINYIKGLKASEEGLNSEALTYLNKVNPSDEYYRESRLIIDKINLINKQTSQELLTEKTGKIIDTVVLKVPSGDPAQEPVSEAETSVSNNQKPLPYSIKKLVSDFEKQYQLADRSSVEDKKSYLNNMDSLYNEFSLIDISKESNPAINEIDRTALMWMQIRKELINKQLSQSSESDANAIRMIKEEGDRAYLKLQNLMNQYSTK